MTKAELIALIEKAIDILYLDDIDDVHLSEEERDEAILELDSAIDKIMQ